MMKSIDTPLTFSGEEAGILLELLESERARLPVEIRHTDHRSYREELRRRLDIIERLIARWKDL